MSSNKFLQKHYEKVILAGLLLLFSGLLYLQLSVIQESQGKKVDDIVNAGEPPADHVRADYDAPEYSREMIFDGKKYVLGDWDKIVKDKSKTGKKIWGDIVNGKEDVQNVDLMIPVKMAPCPHPNCFKLIPIGCFPPKDAKDAKGVCSHCGGELRVRQNDVAVVEEVVRADEDENKNGIPDIWEKEYDVWEPLAGDDAPEMKDSDNDGFNNKEEYLAQTNPVDAKSHPAYVTCLVLAGEPVAEPIEKLFTTEAAKICSNIMIVDIMPGTKKVRFHYKNVQTGRPTDMPTAKVGDKILYRRKTSVDTGDRLPVTGFTLTAIEGDAKTGKVTLTSDADPKTVFVAQRDKRIVSDYKTIALRNKLNNAEISTKVGAKVVLGTENTGLEEYTVTDLQGAGEGTVVILKNAAGKEFKITMPIDEEPAADQADATEGNAAKAE